MGTKLNVGKDEAQFISRLVQAWTAAQTVVEQLEPVLKGFGLLKDNGSLNTDRVLAIHKKAREG